MVNSEAVQSAEPLEIEGDFILTPWAEILPGAQAVADSATRLGGAAFLSAVIFFN